MHPYIPEAAEEYRRGRIDRREFLRIAALLGAAAATIPSVFPFTARAAQVGQAAPTAGPPKRGGTIPIRFRSSRPSIVWSNATPKPASRRR